jgi:D-tyrosyl-tRNA(Tyr) deacylase
MRVFLQRVKSAKVYADGALSGGIGAGLIAYCGFCAGDDTSVLEWVANKIVELRIFTDAQGKMNLSVKDIGGSLLVISNFSLYGNTARGRRPDFSQSAPKEISEPLYNAFLDILSKKIDTQSGIFAANMQVESIGDGPINIMVEKHKKEEE